jgi:hypothetical protein
MTFIEDDARARQAAEPGRTARVVPQGHLPPLPAARRAGGRRRSRGRARAARRQRTRPRPAPAQPSYPPPRWPPRSTTRRERPSSPSAGTSPTAPTRTARWPSPGRCPTAVRNPFIRIGTSPVDLGERIQAEVRALTTPRTDVTSIDNVPASAPSTIEQYYLHATLRDLRPGETYYYSVGHDGFDVTRQTLASSSAASPPRRPGASRSPSPPSATRASPTTPWPPRTWCWPSSPPSTWSRATSATPRRTATA